MSMQVIIYPKLNPGMSQFTPKTLTRDVTIYPKCRYCGGCIYLAGGKFGVPLYERNGIYLTRNPTFKCIVQSHLNL